MPNDDRDRVVDRNIPPDEQPAAITAVGRFDIDNFQGNGLQIFVDEQHHLCVKGPDGTICYVVLSTVPPDTSAPIIPPPYLAWEAQTPKPLPDPEPTPVEVGERPTLWDHLRDDEGKDGQ